MIKTKLLKQIAVIPIKASFQAETNERGVVLVVVLLVLTLLTITGISATHMSTTESLIVRNTAIHKQNLQLAEMAAMEGVRRILDWSDASDLEPASSSESWLFEKDPVFVSSDGSGSQIRLTGLPAGVKIDSDVEPYTESNIIDQRGEQGDEPLWYFFVGWEEAEAYKMDDDDDDALLRTGKVVGVYNSSRHGRAAVEIGVKKLF